MHSHHSHSGDYSAHGTDPLDSVVNQVINLNFHTYCLTEHIPRIERKFIYPEELSLGKTPEEIITKLETSFKNFMSHAQEIKARYTDKPDVRTQFIIGMEIESCDKIHIEYAKRIMKENSDILKFCVGSVHHVNGIPIDFDQTPVSYTHLDVYKRQEWWLVLNNIGYIYTRTILENGSTQPGFL